MGGWPTSTLSKERRDLGGGWSSGDVVRLFGTALGWFSVISPLVSCLVLGLDKGKLGGSVGVAGGRGSLQVVELVTGGSPAPLVALPLLDLASILGGKGVRVARGGSSLGGSLLGLRLGRGLRLDRLALRAGPIGRLGRLALVRGAVLGPGHLVGGVAVLAAQELFAPATATFLARGGSLPLLASGETLWGALVTVADGV